jgi:hypothetical protein
VYLIAYLFSASSSILTWWSKAVLRFTGLIPYVMHEVHRHQTFLLGTGACGGGGGGGTGGVGEETRGRANTRALILSIVVSHPRRFALL